MRLGSSLPKPQLNARSVSIEKTTRLESALIPPISHSVRIHMLALVSRKRQTKLATCSPIYTKSN